MSTSDYDFVTDRLAIGNVASRATPGFCAVVSLLATDRPGTLACEVTGAPKVPNNDKPIAAIADRRTHWRDRPFMLVPRTMVLHIDLADGECHSTGPAHDRYGKEHPSRGLEDYLDDATSFIAAHLRRGCVLVHCGAGKSRSVAVVIAYLCRYAGMCYTEAAALVAERRPGACPAPCFTEAIKRWLRLDELATKGPREAHTLLDLTKLPTGTVIEFTQEPRWAYEHRNITLRKGDRASIEGCADGGGVRLRITHAYMLITAGDSFGHFLRAMQPACIVKEDAAEAPNDEHTNEAIAQGR